MTVHKVDRFEQAFREPEQAPLITQEQIEALIATALKIVGARLLLGVGLVGAIGLAVLAVQAGSIFALQAQGIFTLTVFAPLVWLSSKRAI